MSRKSKRHPKKKYPVVGLKVQGELLGRNISSPIPISREVFMLRPLRPTGNSIHSTSIARIISPIATEEEQIILDGIKDVSERLASTQRPGNGTKIRRLRVPYDPYE